MAYKGYAAQSTVAQALESALKNMDGATKVRESLSLAYWSRVVGPQAAAASEPEIVRDGVLFVRTRSSVWSHELNLLKFHIVSELNRHIGRQVIKEIVFRAQGVEKAAPEEIPTGFPTEEELAAVRFSSKEQAELRRELEGLTGVKNEKLREAVAHRVVRARKLRRWRLEHGWRVCRRCTTVHQADGDLCPVCRK